MRNHAPTGRHLHLSKSSGKRYFGPVEGQHLLADPDVVIRGDRVLHLRYRVRR